MTVENRPNPNLTDGTNVEINTPNQYDANDLQDHPNKKRVITALIATAAVGLGTLFIATSTKDEAPRQTAVIKEVPNESPTTAIVTTSTPTTEAVTTTQTIEIRPVFTCPIPEGSCVPLETDFDQINFDAFAERGYQVYMQPGLNEMLAESGNNTSGWSDEQWNKYAQIALPNFYTLLGVASTTDNVDRVRELTKNYLPIDEQNPAPAMPESATLSGSLNLQIQVSGGFDPRSQEDFIGIGPSDRVFKFNSMAEQLSESSITILRELPGTTTVVADLDINQNYANMFVMAEEANVSINSPANRGFDTKIKTFLHFNSNTGQLTGYDLLITSDDDITSIGYDNLDQNYAYKPA